jgi:TPR repeat protein
MFRKRIAAGFVALALPLGFAAPVAAGPLEDSLAAYQRGDYATALRLIGPLADRGDPNAQYRLGVLYDQGHGVLQDSTAAMRWYRKAADQGNTDAQFTIGIMYAKGEGVPQDFAAAVAWYRKAAEQGYASAQNNLGTMYTQGEGVPQDFVFAHMWFNLAAAAGNQDALQNRDGVARRMTSAQIAEAQKLARGWKPAPN